jgi:hypothetical protein
MDRYGRPASYSKAFAGENHIEPCLFERELRRLDELEGRA